MSRIPVALQAVFLASNRGQEVHTPPPGRLVNRVFVFRGNGPRAPRASYPRRNGPRGPRKWLWSLTRRKSTKECPQEEEEKISRTASGSSGPTNEIIVPAQEQSRKSLRHGRPSFRRVDSSTSSITFFPSRSSAKKGAKPKVGVDALPFVRLHAYLLTLSITSL